MVHNHTEWCPVMWYQEEQRQRLGWVPSIEDYRHVRRGAPFDTCFALSASICIVIIWCTNTIGLVWLCILSRLVIQKAILVHVHVG
jgi:hypothetical protein